MRISYVAKVEKIAVRKNKAHDNILNLLQAYVHVAGCTLSESVIMKVTDYTPNSLKEKREEG